VVKTAAPEHPLSGPLTGLSADAGYTPLIVGRDSAGAFVPLLMFRPVPTTVTFIGDWRTARILLLRCLGLGARVAIRAGGGLAETSQWTLLDRAAGGSGRRVWPMPAEQPVPAPLLGTPLVLHVFDNGMAGPAVRQATVPWHTQLTVLGSLSGTRAQAVANADIVLAQRLEPAEASHTAAVLGHPEATAAALSSLPEDMLAVLSRGSARYAWLTPTTVERRLFGG
jgi:hypothetical protein